MQIPSVTPFGEVPEPGLSGRPAKALAAAKRSVGSNPTLSARKHAGDVAERTIAVAWKAARSGNGSRRFESYHLRQRNQEMWQSGRLRQS